MKFDRKARTNLSSPCISVHCITFVVSTMSYIKAIMSVKYVMLGTCIILSILDYASLAPTFP